MRYMEKLLLACVIVMPGLVFMLVGWRPERVVVPEDTLHRR